ncbi:DnaB helicase C-terminal domain-containing protein [Stieleria sp. TO1_6]|uniref:DnaB helicase C-terminal domain-containing protein n=1 Tax=Stieleria tagensis TaxID=2956795 RepID=UPI00209B1489|nr:DnaB helicase C-terminal domain-containing protein [Stieleria tagensis]MCO8124498.1 DnaB helicase C-terminal domain-containing protein [Stieleria tagensis]
MSEQQSTDVAEFLRALHPDGVFEIRAPQCPDRPDGTYKRTVAGYFDDHDAAAKCVQQIEGCQPAGIYVSLNPIDDSLLAVTDNALDWSAKSTAKDADIACRSWLFIDIDAQRRSGISSTDAELYATQLLSFELADYLSGLGWPAPLSGMSGNGSYLLYRIDLPNDDESTGLIHTVLRALAARFDTDDAHVDTGTANPSRIIKLLGTVARKGADFQPESRPQAEHRPHRQSWFKSPAGEIDTAGLDQLQAVAAEWVPEQPPTKPEKPSGGLRMPKPMKDGDYESAARRAMEKVSEGCQGESNGDGSSVLVKLCRQVKRFGFDGDDGVRFVQNHLVNYPLGKDWTKDEIAKRIADAKVKPGEACNDSPPWEPSGERTAQPKPSKDDRPDQVEVLDNGADVFDRVADDLLEGKADNLFDCGDAFPMLEVGPGLLTIIGAPPGAGKSAMAMQVLYDAIANHTQLHAVVASLEMGAATLIKRKLAALLGCGFNAVRFNNLTDYQRQQVKNQHGFRDSLKRIGFLKQDHSGLGDLEAMLANSQRPGLLLLDYVQLFGSADANAQDRGAQTMATARRFCEAGWAVIAVSAVNRASYAAGGMGAFRDTSGIEYSGTSAYLLEEAEDHTGDRPSIREMKLRCIKNRNGPLQSLDLLFNGPQMLFSPREPVSEYEGAFDSYNAGTEADEPAWMAGK